MEKLKTIILSAILVGALAACGTTTSPEEEIDDTPSEEIVDEDNGTGESPTDETNGDTPADDEEQLLIPEMKELEVIVEGEVEKRIAHLTVSDLDYSLFVLEGYSLEAEEPGRDVLLMDYDNEFFVRIEPLGTDVNVESVEATILEHAEGTIHENTDVPLDGVEYSILEEIRTDNEITSLIHVAKDYNGNLFKFTVFLPLKEAAEGAGPSFWAMLDTISAQQ
ncbi:hypothetical protein [Bacillus sp. FJAT-45350]|uniref:hypothetical protein n=1 Tax=Bacillus sp. FJAT-45350 TaxID=2011014 RepID=UPI000BB9B01B|nr:hypothetical protein [Bacillus sp. FJAT-45350]